MRVLRLRVDSRRIVDLHPSLSVVHRLEPEQAATLRRGVASVAGGLAPLGDGLLEAHGLLLDATQGDLDLLDLATDPVGAVVTTAHLREAEPGDAGDERAERLRTAERDVLLLATDRRWAARALESSAASADPAGRELARAEQLRTAIALHEGTDVEPLRRALDADRDARRAAPGDPDAGSVAAVADELAALGIDLRRPAVDDDEVRRVADDLLDEHLRHASWVVGARVELEGLEQRLIAALPGAGDRATPPSVATLPESAERRLERATDAHAAAVARADELRQEVEAVLEPLPARDLEWALLRRLSGRRREHPAGTAPVVLDRVLRGLADEEVERLLDRIEPLGRGVQLIVVDDHPAAVRWAATAGSARAALVHPTPARPVGRSPTMPRDPRQPPR